jgi:hypothetical protein
VKSKSELQITQEATGEPTVKCPDVRLFEKVGWSVKVSRKWLHLVIVAPRNHDLKIFPCDTYVLRLNSDGFIGLVGRSETISGIGRPLLDVFLVRRHQFCTTTLG